jgi:hypothetical protein
MNRADAERSRRGRADAERLRYQARKHGLIARKLRVTYKAESALFGLWQVTTADGTHLLTGRYDEVVTFVERRALVHVGAQ